MTTATTATPTSTATTATPKGAPSPDAFRSVPARLRKRAADLDTIAAGEASVQRYALAATLRAEAAALRLHADVFETETGEPYGSPALLLAVPRDGIATGHGKADRVRVVCCLRKTWRPEPDQPGVLDFVRVPLPNRRREDGRSLQRGGICLSLRLGQ